MRRDEPIRPEIPYLEDGLCRGPNPVNCNNPVDAAEIARCGSPHLARTSVGHVRVSARGWQAGRAAYASRHTT